MKTLRAVFFGTPEWAVPSLRRLAASDHVLVAVVTNPDKPAGRRRVPTPSPVKRAALELASPEILQPVSARDPAFHEMVRRLEPDIGVVVAYGKILPRELLGIPRLGFVNLHFSLLPAYRGAAPVQRALMAGETITGSTVIVLTEGMDEGPILAGAPVAVAAGETAGELGSRLAAGGAALLLSSIEGYATGRLHPVSQDEGRATYAPKVGLDDARIDWTRPAKEIVDLVRGTTPEPGPWTTFRDKKVKLFGVARDGPEDLAPGGLRGSEQLLVGTGSDAVLVAELQREGGRRLPASEFLRGLRIAPGEGFS